MALKDDLDSAVAALYVDLDAMLDPGVKTAVDQDLIDQVQSGLEDLATDHNAEAVELWQGAERAADADRLAHWLFDGQTDHRLRVTAAPTSDDELLVVTIDVPRT